MFKKLTRLNAAAISLAVITLGSCVDNDYDLSEDIDLNMTLGGNLITLPSSSTGEITLSEVLDLDENESSIKTAKYDGQYGVAKDDYVLVQDGSSEPANFDVPEVEIDGMAPNTMKSGELTYVNLGVEIPPVLASTTNTIKIHSNNVPSSLKELLSATTDIDIRFTVAFESTDFTGTAYINEGFKATFPDTWTLEVDDPETAAFISVQNKHDLVFTKQKGITKDAPMHAVVRLVHVNLEGLPAGQGLTNGEFKLDNTLTAEGMVSVTPGDLPLYQTANLKLVTTTEIVSSDPLRKPRILEVTGRVDPEINVDATSFTISDIPDFLSDEGNNLDVENPQINLIVNNDSPLSLEVSGKLTAYVKDAQSANIEIGSKYGKKQILVTPGNSTIVLSRRPISDPTVTNVVVDNLGDLISTIPDRISFDGIECKALEQPVTFQLGKTYTFDAKYEAVVPLAFGQNMKLHYTHEETDWDTDLDDYNFKEVGASLNVVSTLPLEMTPKVKALGVNGQEITTVVASVEGTVAPGTIASPKTSKLKITIKSTGGNLSDLDGIRLIFDAKTPAEMVGVNLNANQILKFEDICLEIRGGITVDLNDMDEE